MSLNQNASLIDILIDCAAECNQCITDCLAEQNAKEFARCIKLNIDCAAICSLTAGFIARGSEHADHLLPECAAICNACAEECETHAHMEHCKACADVCRECAEACMQMELA